MKIKILDDGSYKFFETFNGIRVVPVHGQWAGFYRLDPLTTNPAEPRLWQMILTGISFGTPPGILTIAIRSYEDIENYFKRK